MDAYGVSWCVHVPVGISWCLLVSHRYSDASLLIPIGASWCLYMLCGCILVLHGAFWLMLILILASWCDMGTLKLFGAPLLLP